MTSIALINGQSHRLQHRQTHRHLGRNLPSNLLRRRQPNTKCAVLLMCLDGKVSRSPSAAFAGRALLAAARAARMATRSSRSITRRNRAASSATWPTRTATSIGLAFRLGRRESASSARRQAAQSPPNHLLPRRQGMAQARARVQSQTGTLLNAPGRARPRAHAC